MFMSTRSHVYYLFNKMKWILLALHCQERNVIVPQSEPCHFATNSNSIVTIYVVNLRYFKFTILDLTKFIVRYMKDLHHWFA